MVRIDYDITVDTVETLIQKVNSSDANVYMFYDSVSDRFVLRNKNTGATGILCMSLHHGMRSVQIKGQATFSS